MFIKMQNINVILMKQKHRSSLMNTKIWTEGKWVLINVIPMMLHKEFMLSLIAIPEKSPRSCLVTCSKTSQVISAATLKC